MSVLERNKKITKIICAALVVAMLGISITIYKAPLGQLSILLLFIFLYVQIPGLLLLKGLDIKKNHISTKLALGTLLGWAFCILEYFITDLIDNNILLYSIGLVMSLAYLFSLTRKKSINNRIFTKDKFNRLPTSFCIFFALVLFYCLVNTQYKYLSPEVAESIYINPDKAYHMGYINSLSHDYPLQSPWVHGVFVKYHIFTEILWSVPVRLFGISSDVIVHSFAPIFTAYIVSLSFYSMFREMSSKNERAGIYCIVFIFANMYITRRWNSSIGLKFILENDNSTGYGIAVALMFVVVFNRWYDLYCQKKKSRYSYLLICTILVMLATGIKGPIGAVIVAGLWGTVVLGIIIQKVSIKTIMPMLIITGGFLLIYSVILGASGQVNSSGGATIGFGGIANIAFWKNALAGVLKSAGLPKSLRMPIMMLVFSLFFFTAYFVPFIAGYIREIVLVLLGKKEYYLPKVLVYAECLVGYLAMFMLHYRGHNQIYFGMITVALSPMIAYWFIEDMEKKRNHSVICKRTLQITIGIMVASMIFTSTALITSFSRYIKDAQESSKPSHRIDKYLSISRDEYKAMKWIRSNTEPEALFINDRYYSVNSDKYVYDNRWDNRFFLYEAFSNRFSYLGGSGYDLHKVDNALRKERIDNTEKLINETNENRGILAKELEIDYVIVSKRFSGERKLDDQSYEKCFSNNDIDIYRIRY